MTTSNISAKTANEFSIMHRIVDGTLRINSIDEFEEILAIYPDDPLLYRKYADLLIAKERQAEGMRAYDKAVELFIEHGMNLQAIVAKILLWSIAKPSHDQGREFHSLLHDKGSRQTPLQRLWSQMSYPELVSIMLRLVRLRMPPGKKVVLEGDPANHLYFVVSGSLMETVSDECEQKAAEQGIETEPILLGDNDIFGDIFPLDGQSKSHTEIRTVTEAELVRIKKSVLAGTCAKYPNVEMLLRSLLKSDYQDDCDRQWQTVRRGRRFGVPTKVEVHLGSPEQNDDRSRCTGIALDLSLNGICIDLGTDPQGSFGGNLKGRFVQLRLDLMNEVALLDISGKIVWHQRQNPVKRSAALIGIRFDSMDKSDRELLIEYCASSDAEQNLLWSLWHTMVRNDNPQE